MEARKKRNVEHPKNNHMELENLPDHVIHEIMHLLPYEDATKFSVLSKSFYSYWLTFPTVYFRYKASTFYSDDVSYQTFFNHVLKTLQLRKPYMYDSLHNLTLSYVGRCCSYPNVLDVLLIFALKNKVKEINLDIKDLGDDLFHPIDFNVTRDLLLPLFSSQFLTVLKLTGIRIPPVDAYIKCPKLEELVLKFCDGFQTINVPSASASALKQVEVEHCIGLRAFHISGGKGLQSFALTAHDDEPLQCALDFSDSSALRVLKLITARTVTDQWLNSTIRGLPYLEELLIRDCSLLQKIGFENSSLKKFSLYECLELKEVCVHAPSLLEFNFSGSIEHPICIISPICNGNILLPHRLPNLTFARQFLSCFDHFRGLSLSCSRLQVLTVPRPYMLLRTLSPMYDLRHLKLELLYEPLPRGQPLIELLEGILWLMPKPRTIALYSVITKTMRTLKFEYGTKVELTDLMVGGCCGNFPIKCWRHFELKIEFEGFDECAREYLNKFFTSLSHSYRIYKQS